jgi:hypothetical protein
MDFFLLFKREIYIFPHTLIFCQYISNICFVCRFGNTIFQCLSNILLMLACIGKCTYLIYTVLLVILIYCFYHSVPSVTLHPSGEYFVGQSMDNSLVTYQCGEKVKLLLCCSRSLTCD